MVSLKNLEKIFMKLCTPEKVVTVEKILLSKEGKPNLG
jgi:hypothetical protein